MFMLSCGKCMEHITAVVQFSPSFNCYFPLNFCLTMYGNECKTKENKRIEDKIEPEHNTSQ